MASRTSDDLPAVRVRNSNDSRSASPPLSARVPPSGTMSGSLLRPIRLRRARDHRLRCVAAAALGDAVALASDRRQVSQAPQLQVQALKTAGGHRAGHRLRPLFCPGLQEHGSSASDPVEVRTRATARPLFNPQSSGFELAQCALGRFQGLRLRHCDEVPSKAAGDQVEQFGSGHAGTLLQAMAAVCRNKGIFEAPAFRQSRIANYVLEEGAGTRRARPFPIAEPGRPRIALTGIACTATISGGLGARRKAR
jgi:hypothetical protein